MPGENQATQNLYLPLPNREPEQQQMRVSSNNLPMNAQQTSGFFLPLGILLNRVDLSVNHNHIMMILTTPICFSCWQNNTHNQ